MKFYQGKRSCSIVFWLSNKQSQLEGDSRRKEIKGTEREQKGSMERC